MEFFGCLGFLLVFVPLVLSILAYRKLNRAEEEIAKLRGESASLRGRIARLETLTRHAAPPERPPQPEPPPPPPEPVPPTPQPPIASEPIYARPVRPPEPPPLTEPAFEPAAAAYSAKSPEPPLPQPEPAAPPPPPPPPPSPSFKLPSFDWESLVGVKLFSWIAGIALALAAVFFLKYSVEHGWLRPAIRMALGLFTGTGLLVVCELRVARHYRVTADAMNAAGIAILYSTLFASYARWQLVPLAVAFALMALVTAVAVLLSIRRDSVFIALLGLVGGFATPALLSTGEDRPIGLFSYLLLLNAGLAWVSYKKKWPVLAVLTLIFTTFYQWLWVVQFLDSAKLPIAIAIFLVFPIVSVIAFWIGRREVVEESTFERTATMSAALPLVFAIYTAAVPAYGARTTLLFLFLLLVDAGLAIIAASRRGPGLLHLLGGVGTALTFVVFCAFSYRSAAWPEILGWSSVFVVLYAAAPELVQRFRGEFDLSAQNGVLVAPTLLFVFAALAGIEPATAQPALLFGVLFALLVVISTAAIRYGQARVYALGAFFTLVAEAVWSSKHLTPERINTAMLLYLAFALFFVGVPFVARRFGQPLQLARSGPVLLYLTLGLLFFLAVGAIANVSLLAIAFLMIVVIAGLLLEPSLRENPMVLAVAILISWAVLLAWWISATVTLLLVPALIVIAGLVVVTVLAYSVLQRKAEVTEEGAAARFGDGVYLGLVGHGFLLYVASQRELSVPPWPMLGALAVLVLALGVAALYARRANVQLASLIAAQVILLIWEETAQVHPWPSIATFGAGLLMLVGLAWFAIARTPRLNQDETNQRGFAITAATAAVLGQIVTLVAVPLPGSPALPLVIATHLLLILGLMRLAWTTGWHVLSIIAVPASAMGYFMWRGENRPEEWPGELAFATVIYLSFIAYPLLLGARARRSIEPYLAAVLASVPYFFFSRTSWIALGWEPFLGLLPILQGILMVILLMKLLRIEPPQERTLARLALVAAAALAFVTVAIPLQLEKEWITIGWALEVAALIWLYRRIPHRGLIAWSAGLAAVVFARLALNPAVLEYHPRSAVPIFNWYLYTYVIPAAALFLGARLLPKDEEHTLVRKVPPLYSTLATILLFLVLNIEIADFYSKGATITFNFSAGLAQDLTYTLGWAIFAIGMLIAGIVLKSRATRISSLALLVVSVLKCFLHDLMRLGGLYRVGSLFGLAISLALVAVLLQRFVMVRREVQPS